MLFLVDQIFLFWRVLLSTGKEPENLTLYVDDSWAIWENDEDTLKEFIKALESPWDTVKFTYDIEKDGKITFLDMVIKRSNGTISYEFFQKATHSGTYLDYNSHCPIIIKINIIKNET